VSRGNGKVKANLQVRPGSMVRYADRTWQVWARADRPGYWWLAAGGIYDQAHVSKLEATALTERLHP
jgi:hypothetical protein